ncbi:MAG TPA: DNA polymerase III subunit delta [Chloroflexia bacterium]|nr:DNA polymerase III subunit delta [Chloroflexia bacterium]
MLYLFYGEDQFSLNEELQKLKSDNISPEVADFNFVKLDALKSGFTVDDVLNNADAYPFLSDKRLVVVTSLIGKLAKSAAAEERAASRAATKAARTRSATATQAPTTPRERFLDFLNRVPVTTILVLVEDKVDKRDAIYKAIDKLGAVREFEPPKDWALEKWINERAVSDQIKLDRRVAPLLREYLGSDLYRLENELQKLAAYAGEGQAVTPEMVEMMTAEVQDTAVWTLTDALSRSDLRGSLATLNRLRKESTESTQGFTRKMFNIVTKQIYDLLRISELHASRKTVNEIAQAIGMHPFRVEKTIPLIRNFTPERLSRLYARLTELDYLDKKGKADLTIQFDLLIHEICLGR